MDREAFGALYRRHARRLFGQAWQLTGSGAEAEDAVQETFLRALRSLEGYQERGRSGAWLDRILINVIRERGRRRSFYRQRIEPELQADRDAGLDPTPSPESRSVTADRLERVRRALSGVPRTFREVLVLRHFEERSTAEVAEILGLPPATVRTRLKRGREMLRRLCEGGDEG